MLSDVSVMWDMKNTAMVSGSAQSELQTNKLKIARLPSINCFNKVCDIHHWSLWNKVHFDVVSCVKVVHKSYLAGGLQFFNCRKEAWKWFDGIQTDACQIFFGRYLNQSYYKGRSDENIWRASGILGWK